MHITTSLKTLPLIALLALGTALGPTSAQADEKHRYQREHSGEYRDHGKRHKSERRAHRATRVHHGHSGSHHHSRRHAYRHDYHAERHHGHRHREVVTVYDYRPRHHPHFAGFDRLGFMIGLHTGNIDLVIRD